MMFRSRIRKDAMASRLLTHIKARFRTYKAYRLATEVKACLQSSVQKTLKEVDRPDMKVVSLKPDGRPRGNVLFSYISAPFLLKPGEPMPTSHTHYWESWRMATTFLELGYNVDVINYTNQTFLPEKDYAVVVDVRRNLERIAPLLNGDCIKVMHLDTSHLLFHNAGEASRLLALQQRKGVTLQPRRFAMPNWGIESADFATMMGNGYTSRTYAYANKPIYCLPISTPLLYPWHDQKDYEACRKRFIWFGSGGMVHKGLDLVLEVFASMPDYHLTICGPVEREKDFERAYYKELYQTPNIHTVGWVDVTSPEFAAITNTSIGLIYPSCSEGQCGGVVTCLHAGLIPIVSRESGVDVSADFGVYLESCSLEEIRSAVRRVSTLPGQQLQRMARNAWEYARARHTRERFAAEYRKAADQVLTLGRISKDWGANATLSL
jgi:glycosyltransferase involved in cell wall biosynthesis